MNLNPLFSKASRKDFKRDMPWLVMYFLIFLFLIPVGYLFGLQGVRDGLQWLDPADLTTAQERIFNHALQFLGMGFSTVVLGTGGLLEAYHEYGYLHRSREIDFYHSLPTTRKGLFFGRLMNGVRFVMLPYLAAEMTGLLCAWITGAGIRGLIQPVLAAILLNMLAFLLFYLTGILAVMLTGRALTGILGMFVLIGYFPAFGLLLENIPILWYASYYAGGTRPAVITAMEELSPVSQAIVYGNIYGDRFHMPQAYDAVTGGFIFRILIGFAIVCVMILLCMRLYEKRPLEKAGDAMIFAPTEPVIRILLTVFGGMCVMNFMRALDRSVGWVIFFTVAAVILVHVIVEIIYRADAGKALAHKAELIVMTVLAVAGVLMIAFDVFGYDSYLPETAAIESASADFMYNTQYAFYEDDPSGEPYTVFYADSEAPFGISVNLSGENEIEAIRAIAAQGIAWDKENDRKQDGVFRAVKETSEEDLSMTAGVNVTWHLTGGRIVCRNYVIDKEAVRDAYTNLFDSPQYRNSTYPVLSLGEEYFTAAAYEEKDTVFQIENPQKQKELLDAYLMDLRDMTMKEIDGKMPCGLIRLYPTQEFFEKRKADPNGAYESNFFKDWNTRGLFLRYPVFDGFERTAGVLKGEGIDAGAVHFAEDDVFSYNFYEPGDDGIIKEYTGAITDPEEREYIYKYMVISPYNDYNMYGPRTMAMEIHYQHAGRECWGSLAESPETEKIVKRIYEENGLSTE